MKDVKILKLLIVLFSSDGGMELPLVKNICNFICVSSVKYNAVEVVNYALACIVVFFPNICEPLNVITPPLSPLSITFVFGKHLQWLLPAHKNELSQTAVLAQKR